MTRWRDGTRVRQAVASVRQAVAPVPHRRWQALLGALLAGVLAAGCAGIPSSGPAQDVRKVADQTAASVPQGPEPGQQPEQIVREFVHAAALTEFDPPGESFVVARQFLTVAAQKAWRADSGSTPVVVLSDDFSAVPDPEHPGVVTVTGAQIGALDAARRYQPVDMKPYQVSIPLDKVGGQWRITDPPTDVLITQGDFSTAFRQRTVYFLDATGRVVVPDIRYIPNASTADLSANRLMDLLLQGPSATLAGAARTQLGQGAQLQSNVHIDKSGVAHVDLENVDISTPAARQGLAAQIVWTLDPDVQQVAITVNGLPLDAAGGTGTPGAPSSTTDAPATIFSMNTGSVAGFNPDVVPGSAQAVSDAYYISSGAILRLSDGTPMWGQVGTGSVQVVSAALSAASGALAAVTASGDGREQLLVGMPFDHQPTVTALKATTLTRPSFTRWGYAAWTVQNGATQPEIYQVTISAGAPTWSRVAAPDLAGKGTVTALALSPDGVRVAIVAGGALYLGVISPGPDTSGTPPTGTAEPGSGNSDHRGLQVTGLRELRSDLKDVGPVAWEDSTSLLVGAKTAGSAYRTVFDVSVDGQSVDPVTTSMAFGAVFGDVDAIATSSGSDNLPMLISFGGRIWTLQGNQATGRWVSPNASNWLPGTAPFYPN